MTDGTSGSAPRAGAEAARLLSAAQQWLRDSAPHLAPLDADGEPCSCPLCRAVAAVREADPEAVGRWVDTAVSALEQTGRQVAAEAAARAEASRSGPGAAEAPRPPADAPDRADPADGADDGPPRIRRIPLDGAADDG